MATKDKIVNLEDLKVLSDHVEGEVTGLKSDLNSNVGELKSAIDVQAEAMGVELIAFTKMAYINTSGGVGSTVTMTPTVNGNLSYAIVDCKAGDKFVINGRGWTNARLYAFLNESNVILSVSDASVTASNLTVIAPENSAKCVINTFTADVGDCKHYSTLYLKDAVVDLQSTATNLGKITGYSPFDFTRGYIFTGVAVGDTVDLTPVSNNSLSYAIVDVDRGEQIIVNGRGWTNARLWAFVDRNNKLLSVSAQSLTGSDLIITAPATSAKCIINTYASGIGICYKSDTIPDFKNKTNNALTEVSLLTKNYNWTDDGYLKDGEIVPTPSFKSSDYIPIYEGINIHIKDNRADHFTDSLYGALHLYDENKMYITNEPTIEFYKDLTFDANVKYIRFYVGVLFSTDVIVADYNVGGFVRSKYDAISTLQNPYKDYFENIPAKIDFTLGVRSSIYLDGLIADKAYKNKWITFYSRNQEIKISNDSITTQPTTVDNGTNLRLQLCDVQGNVVAEKNCTTRCNAKQGDGSTKSIMICGDSLIGNGEAASKVYAMLAHDNDFVIRQVGSLSSTDSIDTAKTVKHEGRGSWSWESYVNPDYETTPYYGKTNAFMHNGQLDFTHYVNTYNDGYPIDIAIFSLGTNDMGQGGWINQTQRETVARRAVSDAKLLIDALLSACPNCKIAIALPPFGAVTKNNTSEDGLIASMSCLAKHMIATYDDGRYNNNVTCLCHGAYIDRINAYPHTDITDELTHRVSRITDNAIHPLFNGYYQWGIGYYNKIRAFLNGSI